MAKRRPAPVPDFLEPTIQCVFCGKWVACKRGRMRLDTHIRKVHPEGWARQNRLRAKLLGGKKFEKERTLK
jgi:hypothetical protein